MSELPQAPAIVSPPSYRPRWRLGVGLALTALCVASLALAWVTQQRVHTLEQELVKRQQDSQGQSTEARVIAKQAQEVAQNAAAKAALTEARIAEVALQRSQLEELIQSLSRSRDENVVADIESSIRVAMQQAAITGSLSPLLAALKQADERLARYDQPRLQGVRRAIVRDLDRVKAAGTADIASLTVRLDEVIRQVDELPLMAVARPAPPENTHAAPAAGPAGAASAASAPALSSPPPASWTRSFGDQSREWFSRLWSDVRDEARALVRVTRIDNPEAVLVSPDQQFFVRENLKLRLLNARLALLSRQFDVAQSDLREAQGTLERYFDRGSRRVAQTIDIVRQVGTLARQITLPRPDDTLAALATASAGR